MGFGYGKTILFGEHFVVHGLPAIVAGLSWKTTVTVQVQSIPEITLHDQRPRIAGFLEQKQQAYLNMIKNITQALEITQGLQISLAGDLVVTSGGIGASAATAVAITRALNTLYNLKLSDHEINNIALHGERAVHGNPSGIDNTAATFGGLFRFQKNQIPYFFTSTRPVEIVLIDSGFTTPTSQVLAQVADFKQRNPEKFDTLVSNYVALVQDAEQALQGHDLHVLGRLMSNNHALLQQLGVSTPKLDAIVALAEQDGALGAKITGTGCGGLVLALTPGKLQKEIALKFQRRGYDTLQMGIQL